MGISEEEVASTQLLKRQSMSKEENVVNLRQEDPREKARARNMKKLVDKEMNRSE